MVGVDANLIIGGSGVSLWVCRSAGIFWNGVNSVMNIYIAHSPNS